ncbi:MAG TPA: alpha/beta hydrolase [Nostocaceae cyanobacterium]|nr:alpha/beta hydrolase [Nostocaceae cyanobacterium]
MAKNWRSLKIVASSVGAIANGGLLAIAISQLLGINKPVQAAETVVVRFGPFAESTSLAELRRSAETGELPKGLELFTNRLSEQQRQMFIQGIRTKIPLNTVTLSRLLNTQIGNLILSDISKAFDRKDGAGVQALRAGIVLGSTYPDGLSVLNFIAAYPSKQLELDLAQALGIAQSLNAGFWRTQQFMLAIAPPANLPPVSLPFNPTQPGSAKVEVSNLDFTDKARNRTIPVDIYWSTANTPDKPLIVFSHGLGSSRSDLRYLAEHLASYGYVVAAVEHPGSNQRNTSLGIAGYNEILKPQELLERPRDISFVLDQLTQINQTANNQLQGKLATQKVMVVGYSFGGGTALALAGGEFQLEFLKDRCTRNLTTLSLGQFAQCVSKGLPENNYQLRDERIKSAIALNPTTSLIFGENGLTKVQVPTLIFTSSADKITTALKEQIIGFTKIPTQKWLVGAIGGTHLTVKDPSTIFNKQGQPNIPLTDGEVIGEKAKDVRNFVKAVTLAMAAQLTPEASKYAVFLTPNYAQISSNSVFPFRILTEIPPEALESLRR